MVAASSSAGSASHFEYRADIDGLRGIAVLLVVAGHSLPSRLPGGFVGVDVFFVVSGFLITGIVLDEVEGNRFAFADFYARRVRRILPALLLVLLATLVAGWFLLVPVAFSELGKEVLAGMGFVPNLHFWQSVGYFDADARSKPLLHLWSLGIEAQFYLAWPVCLTFLRRRGRTRLYVTAGAAMVSFAFSVHVVRIDAAQAFYSPLPRAWELLVGALFSRLPRTGEEKPSMLRELQPVCGVALVAAAAGLLSSRSVFPGFAALLPVAGAALIVSSDARVWFSRRVLSSGVLVGIGLISYSLYLWHWPLLLFATHLTEHDHAGRVVAVTMSFVLAWATYLFVEKPLRRMGTSLQLLCGAAIALVGLLVRQSGGFPSRFSPLFQRAALEARYELWREQKCYLHPPASGFDPGCIDGGDGPLALLWGDSFAGALVPGLRWLQTTETFRLGEFAASGCAPLLGWTTADHPMCRSLNDQTVAVIEHAAPELVLLHANWRSGTRGGYDLARLPDTIAAIRRMKVRRIVLLGQVPVWTKPLQSALLDCFGRRPVPEFTACNLVPGLRDVDALMRRAARELDIDYVSLLDVLCNERGCRTRIGDTTLTAFDQHHLTAEASRFVAEHLRETVFAPMRAGAEPTSGPP